MGTYYAIIEDGVIVNTIDLDPDECDPSLFNAIECPEWAAIGTKYIDGQFIKEAVPTEVLAAEARNQRNALLADSDWTQVPDASVDTTAWAAYRQALRDLPEQEGFPENIVWPEKPS